MSKRQSLLDRLDSIGDALSQDDAALALIGVGSSGADSARMDRYSDLDFFVIVTPEAKSRFIDGLDWLAKPYSLSFSFQNTRDGHKALFSDGIFCEFAVFSPGELAEAAYHGARCIWKREDFRLPPALPLSKTHTPVNDLINEALTNLYVGLLRERRGETLAAFRMIQEHALNRLLEVVELVETADLSSRDPFGIERRFEERTPEARAWLGEVAQGYAKNIASAEAILHRLEEYGPVHPAMRAEINSLLELS